MTGVRTTVTSPITSPRAAPGGTQGEPDVIAGQVAGQQQIALGVVAVEHLLLGQPLEIGCDQPLGAAGIAAHAKADQLRHQHREADRAVRDPLLRHLDRCDIAGVAQDGRGAVADLADRRDIGSSWPMNCATGGAQFLRRQAAQLVEGDLGQGEADVLIFGPVERAGRALRRRPRRSGARAAARWRVAAAG